MYSNDQIRDLFHLFKKNLGTLESLGSYDSSYLFKCPNPECATNNLGHSHGKYKLSVTFSKNVCKCWVCEYSDSLPKLVSKYFSKEDKSEFYKLKGTREYKSYTTTESDNKSNNQSYDTNEHNEFKSLIHDNIVIYDKDEHQMIESCKSYLYSRGLTDELIKYYSISYSYNSSNYNNCIIFPSFDKHREIDYFIAKNYITDKYVLPRAKKNDIIFNEWFLDFSKPLILVEGIFDYYALHTFNRVPLLGSYLSKKSRLFNNIIRNKTPIILILDEDAQRKSINMQSMLFGHQIETKNISMKQFNVNDLGELMQQQQNIKSLIQSSIDTQNFSNTKADILRRKLQMI